MGTGSRRLFRSKNVVFDDFDEGWRVQLVAGPTRECSLSSGERSTAMGEAPLRLPSIQNFSLEFPCYIPNWDDHEFSGRLAATRCQIF